MNWFRKLFENKAAKVKVWLARDDGRNGGLRMFKSKPLKGAMSFIVPNNDYEEPEEFKLITWDNSPIEAEIRFKIKESDN